MHPAGRPPTTPLEGQGNNLVYDDVWKRFYYVNVRAANGSLGQGGVCERCMDTWAYRIGGPVGPGDANCDGRATAADVSGLIQLLASNPTDGCGVVDTNRDGVVDKVDVSRTLDALFEAPQ
jgi:hypothetical protein